MAPGQSVLRSKGLLQPSEEKHKEPVGIILLQLPCEAATKCSLTLPQKEQVFQPKGHLWHRFSGTVKKNSILISPNREVNTECPYTHNHLQANPQWTEQVSLEICKFNLLQCHNISKISMKDLVSLSKGICLQPVNLHTPLWQCHWWRGIMCSIERKEGF